MTHTLTVRIATLANLGYHGFVTDTRSNGETFSRIAELAPDWLSDVCLAAHDAGNMLPDDMRYEMIRSAFATLSDAEDDTDLDEMASEFADAEPSVYNMARLHWLASHRRRAEYVEDAIESYGVPDPFNLYDVVALGWMTEAREVFDTVVRELTELAEEQENAEDES